MEKWKSVESVGQYKLKSVKIVHTFCYYETRALNTPTMNGAATLQYLKSNVMQYAPKPIEKRKESTRRPSTNPCITKPSKCTASITNAQHLYPCRSLQHPKS
ncbi:hypothetical protein DdX_14530 [Ditylenchus destructor]|uniref:Uncharacterized protein n=1 Tax=Ditylenchus destructor TaxID=166010 RepID=A0AAD4MR09_9BILA|nr:hypothetical protein DdX_14530 [Ditylenchus destructor]